MDVVLATTGYFLVGIVFTRWWYGLGKMHPDDDTKFHRALFTVTWPVSLMLVVIVGVGAVIAVLAGYRSDD